MADIIGQKTAEKLLDSLQKNHQFLVKFRLFESFEGFENFEFYQREKRAPTQEKPVKHRPVMLKTLLRR